MPIGTMFRVKCWEAWEEVKENGDKKVQNLGVTDTNVSPTSYRA